MIAYQALFSPQEEGPSYGEPEWLPGLVEVERARRELERGGIIRGLKREAPEADKTPAGEPPWSWLAGAAAWVIIWPAVIALRFGQNWWPWLPAWLPIVLAALHMLLLIIPVLRSQRGSSQEAVRRQFARVQTLAQMFALEPDEFETWVGMLFTLRGYEVQNTQYVADHGVDLVVTGEGVMRGLVQCKRYRGTVGEPAVRELYGTHMHENADYSWLTTTGAISRKAREWAAGKPIELWDGQRLMELARKVR
jgi:hypothetical protein